jgi:hypothetical protein
MAFDKDEIPVGAIIVIIKLRKEVIILTEYKHVTACKMNDIGQLLILLAENI